jgi:hypothetical protein
LEDIGVFTAETVAYSSYFLSEIVTSSFFYFLFENLYSLPSSLKRGFGVYFYSEKLELDD